MFVPRRHFQPRLIFNVEHLKSAALGKALALPTNIRLDWKGLRGANTLAYYKKHQSPAEKVLQHWDLGVSDPEKIF